MSIVKELVLLVRDGRRFLFTIPKDYRDRKYWKAARTVDLVVVTFVICTMLLLAFKPWSGY